MCIPHAKRKPVWHVGLHKSVDRPTFIRCLRLKYSANSSPVSPSAGRTSARAHLHTHTRTHTLTHFLTHARVHVRMHARTHARTHHVHLLMHSRLYMQAHSCTHLHMHARTNARTNTHRRKAWEQVLTVRLSSGKIVQTSFGGRYQKQAANWPQTCRCCTVCVLHGIRIAYSTRVAMVCMLQHLCAARSICACSTLQACFVYDVWTVHVCATCVLHVCCMHAACVFGRSYESLLDGVLQWGPSNRSTSQVQAHTNIDTHTSDEQRQHKNP